MPKPSRRQLTTVDQKWRKPEYEAHINKYPFALASLIAGSAAALIGLMISFVIVVAIWLLAAHGTESTIQVVRASAIAWQATHLVPLNIAGVPVGILPWGFLVIPAVIIWKTMHWALKSALPENGRQFWLVAVYYSLTYALISGLVSILCSTEGLSTAFIEAILHNGLIALVISISVLVDFAPSPTILTDRLPRDFVVAIKPGVVAFLTFWVISAIATTVSLIFKWDEIKAISGLMAPSSIDQLFLIFLSVGYLPTIITWTFSYLVGAGIHLGGSAIVSTSLATPGALPAFPLLSILPSSVIPWSKYLILIPVLVGIILYFLVPRDPWKAQGDSFPVAISHIVRFREITRILFAVIVFLFCAYFVTAFSGGPLGTGYLVFIGPDPTEVLSWSIKTVGLAAALTLIIPRLILTTMHWWTVRPKPEKVDSVD